MRGGHGGDVQSKNLCVCMSVVGGGGEGGDVLLKLGWSWTLNLSIQKFYSRNSTCCMEKPVQVYMPTALACLYTTTATLLCGSDPKKFKEFQ